MIEKLSRLEEVELREVWDNEPGRFTPWLADEENLGLLGDTLGLQLELEGMEIKGEGFQADILCKDTEDNSWVIIENQLEETDYKHLGQTLTYAAGLNANTIVWIAKKFKDEHRAVFDKLNEITDERYRYFGVEIKVWKINNSVPAPQFNIVCKPNNVTRSISTVSTNDWKTNYWSKFREHLLFKNSRFKIYKPQPINAVIFGIGRAGFNLEARISKQIGRIGIRLLIKIDDAIAYFRQLYSENDSIEEEIGEKLEWEENPNKIASVVSLHNSDHSPEKEEDWAKQHAWLAEKLELFSNVFRQRIQNLDPSDVPLEDVDDTE